MSKRSRFRYFRTSPEVIRLAEVMYVRSPLALRNVEGLLHEPGIRVSHETVRVSQQNFGVSIAEELPGTEEWDLSRNSVLAGRFDEGARARSQRRFDAGGVRSAKSAGKD